MCVNSIAGDLAVIIPPTRSDFPVICRYGKLKEVGGIQQRAYTVAIELEFFSAVTRNELPVICQYGGAESGGWTKTMHVYKLPNLCVGMYTSST